jgi:hypothetical protein
MELKPHEVPPDMLATVAEVTPGFQVEGVLHRSATSVLLAGNVWGDPAVAKLLTSAVPFWRETFAREIDTYRFFEEHPPPFRVARLLAADELRPLLVLERLPGEQLLPDRHPAAEMPPRRLAALFTAIGRVNGWREPVGVLPPVLDYRSRLERHRRDGLLTLDEAEQLGALLGAVTAREFCHGDPVPPAVVRPSAGLDEGDYAFVDWAFAGTFLPGFDLAKIWVVLRATFGVRSEIEDRVRAAGAQAWQAFLVNLAFVLTQELRNRAAAGGARLAALEADWRLLREWLAAE